jgi:hypothetical protein
MRVSAALLVFGFSIHIACDESAPFRHEQRPLALFRRVKSKKQQKTKIDKEMSSLHDAAEEGGAKKVGFMIAGAQKCGSSYFKNVLQIHQHVWMPFGEPHYFDNNLQKGAAWYHKWFRSAPKGALLGEKTPDYMRSGLTLFRIKRYNPKMKLIFVLRDPVKVCANR